MSFEIAPSRIVRGIVWGLHGLAWLAIGLADLPLAVQGTAAVLVAASLYGWSPQPVCSLRADPDGVLHYRAGRAPDAAWVACRVDGASHVSPLFCSLILWPQTQADPQIDGRSQGGQGGKPRRVLVVPDSLPGEDFRRLRVWLRRWGGV